MGNDRGLRRAVFLDRDGTIILDRGYVSRPEAVELLPGAARAIRRLNEGGFLVVIVSNQSGIGRGLLTPEQVAAVNRRVDELLGPFDTWQVCPHGRDDGCTCRKPAPGMVKAACAELGVEASRTVLVGDIGSDVEAAAAAGAAGLLVPTAATRRDEVRAAEHAAPDLAGAVDDILAGHW